MRLRPTKFLIGAGLAVATLGGATAMAPVSGARHAWPCPLRSRPSPLVPVPVPVPGL